MLTEFKEFLEKFNVIPAAVGLVIALAVLPLIDSVIAVILSLIGAVGGLEVNFDEWAPAVNGTPIPFGAMITALFSFIMLAFIIFMIVKAIAKAGANTAPAATPDQGLLTEIRDLLQAQNKG